MAGHSTGTFLIPTDVQQQNKPRLLLNRKFCQGSYSKFFFNIPAQSHKAKIPRENMQMALFGSKVARLLYLI